MVDKVPSRVVNGRTYYKYERCLSCGAKLVPQRAWNRSSEDERAMMANAGMRKQAVGPYCGHKACQDARARS